MSGASTVLRHGIQRLIRDAQRGDFTVVLAEALDRISRDQADVATLYKHLKFAGVTIVTLTEGEISELRVGLKGTMNALFLKDLAMKTHRGLRGRVEKGKAGGGLCYGYRVLKTLDASGEPIRGDREIVSGEADTIRRIFREFASGKSPKAIAVDLNRDGIPGPLGRAWGDTSIRGHASRGTGIVNNELYMGVLVWNRLRFVKDPSTGKRVSRPNPESQWIRTEVPHLRIVDDELWNAVRARQKQIAEIFGPNPANTREGRMKRVHLANRPTSLLSGLLTCGCCGGKVGIITPNRYACLNHHRRGTCENNRTITRQNIEARVLTGLKEKLVSSEAAQDAFAPLDFATDVATPRCASRRRAPDSRTSRSPPPSCGRNWPESSNKYSRTGNDKASCCQRLPFWTRTRKTASCRCRTLGFFPRIWTGVLEIFLEEDAASSILVAEGWTEDPVWLAELLWTVAQGEIAPVRRAD
ncbi:recombinase family protein [Paracoccus kondratievae]|uniref:recombinase family protein n=1 Tax=Paracoccus kondratievae TaxID=135740 RepID=UPI0035A23E2B